MQYITVKAVVLYNAFFCKMHSGAKILFTSSISIERVVVLRVSASPLEVLLETNCVKVLEFYVLFYFFFFVFFALNRISPSVTICVSATRFDVILDSVGGDTEQWAVDLLKPWSGAKYITLVSPLLLNTDSMGLFDGACQAGFTLHNKAIQVRTSKTNTRFQS